MLLRVRGLNNAHSIIHVHLFVFLFFRAVNTLEYIEVNMNSSLLEVCSSDKSSDRDASSTLNFSSGTKYIKKGRENSSDEGPDTSKNPVRDFEIPDFRIGFRISKQDFGFHFFDKECENRR